MAVAGQWLGPIEPAVDSDAVYAQQFGRPALGNSPSVEGGSEEVGKGQMAHGQIQLKCVAWVQRRILYPITIG